VAGDLGSWSKPREKFTRVAQMLATLA